MKNIDIYGIGTALETSLEIYFRSARHTGRTEHLINSLRDGDVVLFNSHHHMCHFKASLKQFKPRLDVKLLEVMIHPNGFIEFARMADRAKLKGCGEIFFDHNVIEMLYRDVVKSVSGNLKQFIDFHHNINDRDDERQHSVMKSESKWGL